LPGIGVAPHVDRFFWAERVVGLSVIGTCVLRLWPLNETSGEQARSFELPKCSLYCLSGKSRYVITFFYFYFFYLRYLFNLFI
jgi:alkylated DNA repair dioxygenase AlkB